MAEGLAAVGIVANILQLIDYSSKAACRLEQFHSNTKEVPESLRDVHTELPLLSIVLEKLLQTIKDTLDPSTETAITSVINQCQDKIDTLTEILDNTLPQNDDRWGTRTKKALKSLHQSDKIEGIRKALQNHVRSLMFYQIVASSPQKDSKTKEKLEEMHRWLSAPDPSMNYNKALKLRQKDTGLWFLNGSRYDAWKMEPASFIWLYGIPGCGKTILSSTILEDVLRYCEHDPGKVVAYFYFDFNDSSKQKPELMLKSLVSQLVQQLVKIPESVEKLYTTYRDHIHSTDVLGTLLFETIQGLPEVYLVLDALDESTEREALLETLETIASWRLQNLHVLVTSRKEREIEMSFGPLVKNGENAICLQEKVVDADIQKYVRQRLQSDKNLSKWLKDDSIRQEIEDTLISRAHGMFRWAVCQLDTSGKCRNRAMLRKALVKLPPTLDQTYDRILTAIGEEDAQYAFRILQWLAFSFRPFDLNEIAEIVAVDPTEPTFDHDEVLEDPLEILNICSSLVSLARKTVFNYRSGMDELKEVVVLAHYSVKEYLMSERIWKGPAAKYGLEEHQSHDAIANGCLGYLLQFKETEFDSERELEGFKLAKYSADFWDYHAGQTAEPNEWVSDAAIELFSGKHRAYRNWLHLEHSFQVPSFAMVTNGAFIMDAGPLYYPSLFGMRKIAASLINKGADVNAQGGRHGNPLSAASHGGHLEVVQLLLEKGAVVNKQNGEYDTALQAASRAGHANVVRELLEAGADISVKSGYYHTALQAAASSGRVHVVKLLLENGADINAKGGHYSTAIQAASHDGSRELVRLLLEEGADANLLGGHYGSALMAASIRGFEELVSLLLDNGANLHALSGHLRTPLQAAIYGGYPRVVNMLLDRGAGIDVHDDRGETALHTASKHSNTELMKLLLDRGAGIHLRDNAGENALHKACKKHGGEAKVELLLDRSANINSQDESGKTPLYKASEAGFKGPVVLLLDRGANIHMADNKGRCPLQKASKRVMSLGKWR